MNVKKPLSEQRKKFGGRIKIILEEQLIDPLPDNVIAQYS